MSHKNQKFLSLLVEKNIFDEKALNLLLRQYKQDTYEILLHIIGEGLLSREEGGMLYGDGFGFAWLDCNETLFRPEVISKLPKEFSKKHEIVLVYQLGDAITAVMSNPLDQKVIKEAEKITGARISPSFAFREDILDTIEIQYKTVHELEEQLGQIDVSKLITPGREITAVELNRMAGDQSVIDFSQSILLLGVKEGASDIHIEPTEKQVRIRFRVDGLMRERVKLFKDLHAPLISRIKILGGMDISERRKPQDGRISIQLSKKTVDFRVSTAPTIFGEKAVLRILGEVQVRTVPELEDLYLSKAIYDKVIRLVKSSNGVFFVTGPTGSGKTTTLFSTLKRISKPELNVMTVEDPVEYSVPGINQVQINHSIGLNFSTVLRSILRQDPDVILIGEIRDLETAKMATEAALTGHLVLSTLHTNNAIQAVTRLIEIGVEPFIVGPSIIGVMSQRLARMLCDNCKESYTPSRKEMDELFEWDGKTEVKFCRPKGCQICNGSGYKGRIGIHEMIFVTERLREMVIANASTLELKRAAEEEGYLNLRYDGIKKVLRGLTTIDEIDRVAYFEE